MCLCKLIEKSNNFVVNCSFKVIGLKDQEIGVYMQCLCKVFKLLSIWACIIIRFRLQIAPATHSKPEEARQPKILLLYYTLTLCV
jgi:hypothetical protein